MNLQTLQIVAAVDAAADLVQAAEDAGRELRGGDRKHQFYSETVKTGINVFNSPRDRGVCRTDSQVVWRHRQVCASFAGREVKIRS